MTPSTVVLGPADGLAASLASGLGATVVSAQDALPAEVTGAVIVAGTEPAPQLTEAATMTGDDWYRLVDDPMWRTLTALQRIRSVLAADGGRIVVVVPTIGMAGAAGLVAYTTMLEGIRAMVKSAARQWSSHRIGVNLVAAPPALFTAEVAAAAGHLTAAVVTDDAKLLHTVVESVRFLLRPDTGHLVGATLVADGGSVMLP